MAWGLVRTVEPAEEPITLADAKAWARIDHAEDDATISDLIKAARELVEVGCDRTLVTTTWRLTLDSWIDSYAQLTCDACLPGFLGGWYGSVRLPRPRLQSVTSISYVDANGVTQTLSPTLYQVSTAPEPGLVVPAYGQGWPAIRGQRDAVTITYVAGYGAASAVPSTLKQAIRLLVAHWDEHREAVGAPLVEQPLAVQSLVLANWTGEYR